MSLRDYFEERSADWASLYERGADLGSYNFLTRRAAVVDLLASEGAFPRVLDVGCGTGDYLEVAERHDGAYFGLDYATGMIREAVERAGISPESVDQVILGCVGQVAEDGYIARHASVKGGMPIETPAYTVNRICGSGLEAINNAARWLDGQLRALDEGLERGEVEGPGGVEAGHVLRAGPDGTGVGSGSLRPCNRSWAWVRGGFECRLSSVG